MNHRYVAAAAAILLAACSLDSREELIPLEQTPLLVPTPAGFVHSPRIPIAGAPSLHFYLPKGTPTSPSISLRRLGEARPTDSLESFVARKSNSASRVLIGPRDLKVLSSRAIEIAAEYTLIAYSDDGSIATSQNTLHEIVFLYAGYWYACQLQASPEIREKWAPTLREFCSQIRAS